MANPQRDPLGMVAAFCKAMGQPVSQGWEDAEGLRLGHRLIKEEAEEVASAVNTLLFDNTPENRAALTKELADLLYVTHWLAARIGVDLNEAFRLVHESNMSKLVDGKPLRREDGKVLKGPNYCPPDLSGVVAAAPVTLI